MAQFNLITWNIQWGCGCDGSVDLRRIVDTARATADFDVLCLQEVARNFPDLPGSRGEDQFRLLAELLPGYAAIEGIGTDVLAARNARSQFGNMILTRLPVLQAEAAAHAQDVRHSRKEGGPFEIAARPASGILTADFNFRPDDPLYARLGAPFADATPRYVDSWQIAHPGAPHASTLGVFDREQWPAPLACDFIFVTEDLA